MKPFLLLATRPEDEAADDEYAGFLEAGGLAPDQLRRVRLEAGPMPPIVLSDYSGIIVGGSPFNASDPPETKSALQRRIEGELGELLDRVLAEDFPFLGACYGIGLLTSHLEGTLNGEGAEEAGPTMISLTEEGSTDQLFARLIPTFEAFVGHKEACAVLPAGAVLLATGRDCPVQAFRVGRNVYATQFHPELTNAGILTRIRIYREFGYFDPNGMDEVIAAIDASVVTEPATLMKAFVERFATED
ncbi:glutamine amidotransferase [Cryobacterium sp. TMT1-21]|uniref:Glutamine amidotransferase n=1 Tax=Cryobacterium shii TaxID=1259235 RepID=A0AAQ2C8D8_9MICO|nr:MULTISPECIES: glutamine amidotransferase [Cryobacterium]TFC52187.1 glutamine amidotransferase [Cryobacterium shii]TFC84740.1 glutamine amidotransferase [Cryobacterium sp. TmT2-59]TFD14535.1 glutamine amidotransferase [Cryobacterium sp. TMT4-10]TFD15686.1 glutamine amidotransferase [Cryobacterium sp. TMT1-21]TFD18985.1 glutamine amidotransferase [Cryobacterium sp. TMT2-23]